MGQPPEPEQTQITTAKNAWPKEMIESSHASAVMDVPDGVIACSFCANTQFRRSRVRTYDLKEILLLRYPLRCTRCNQRQYGSYFTAGISLPPKSLSMRVARDGETWQAWTEQGGDGQKRRRPMSTAIGPKATKLQNNPVTPVGSFAGQSNAPEE